MLVYKESHLALLHQRSLVGRLSEHLWNKNTISEDFWLPGLQFLKYIPLSQELLPKVLKICVAINCFYCIMLFTSLNLFWKIDAITSFDMIASSLEQVETSMKLVMQQFDFVASCIEQVWTYAKIDAIIWLDCIMF